MLQIKKNLEVFSVRKCVCYIYVSAVSSIRLGPQWITICQESCHDGTSVPRSKSGHQQFWFSYLGLLFGFSSGSVQAHFSLSL